MASQTHHFRHGVVILREQCRRIIFSAVHHASLKCWKQFIEPHGNSVTAHGIHGFNEQRISHHANLHSFEVLRSGHSFLGIHVTRTSIHPTQSHQT